MSLDTNKPVESITYNGVAFPLASTGGATTASAVSYTNTNLEGVTNAQGALDALVASKTQAETDIETLGSAIDSMDAKVQRHTTDISTLTSNQNALTQNVNTLNTQYTTLNGKAHTHSNKQLLDWLHLEHETLYYYYTTLDVCSRHEVQIAPELSDGSTDESFNLNDNTITIFSGNTDSITITFPTFPSPPTNRYMSTISFKSGTTATRFSYPTGIIWSGFDIVNGQFVPVAGKYYDIVFWKNNYGFNAAVRGVWV